VLHREPIQVSEVSELKRALIGTGFPHIRDDLEGAVTRVRPALRRRVRTSAAQVLRRAAFQSSVLSRLTSVLCDPVRCPLSAELLHCPFMAISKDLLEILVCPLCKAFARNEAGRKRPEVRAMQAGVSPFATTSR
jgi:hypothetical protein